jgi:predicted nucleic acid-binding protein
VRHPRGILDTSAVLRLRELDEDDLPDEAVITTVTLAELTVGPLVAGDAETRSARQVQVQTAEASYGDPLPFTADAARAFGRVAADLRESGRKSKARAFDALIAAIAAAEGLPVYTFNADDFQGITDLEVVALPPSAPPV